MMKKIATVICLVAGLLASWDARADAEYPLFVVHFTSGPNWNHDLAPALQQGFQGHSANLQRLRKDGDILFGARYGDFGMIFLASESLESARQELDADPGVVNGIFTYEIEAMRVFYPWQDSE